MTFFPRGEYYRLMRYEDASGVSGTGNPAIGYRDNSGEFTLYWFGRVDPDCQDPQHSKCKCTEPSEQHHPSMKNAIKVHGHNGLSEFVRVPDADEPHIFGEILRIRQAYRKIIEDRYFPETA